MLRFEACKIAFLHDGEYRGILRPQLRGHGSLIDSRGKSPHLTNNHFAAPFQAVYSTTSKIKIFYSIEKDNQVFLSS
jgi:hypothetical protein